jgi:hypothetical protein
MKPDGKKPDRDRTPPHLQFITPGTKINEMTIMLNSELGFKILMYVEVISNGTSLAFQSNSVGFLQKAKGLHFPIRLNLF